MCEAGVVDGDQRVEVSGDVVLKHRMISLQPGGSPHPRVRGAADQPGAQQTRDHAALKRYISRDLYPLIPVDDAGSHIEASVFRTVP